MPYQSVLSIISLLLLLSAEARSELVRVELRERSDVLDGRPFGATGPYERIVGMAYFEVDPESPPNRLIVDVDEAPRNERGRVAFAADFYILKPKDLTRGNGNLLLEPPNRGRKRILSALNRASGSPDPQDPQEFGDGLLFDQGYTVVWCGWQYDVPPGKDFMRINAPVASERGEPIRGPIRVEFVPDRPASGFGLGNQGHLPIPIAEDARVRPSLTVRETWNGSRSIIDPATWYIEDNTAVATEFQLAPGKVYELLYEGTDPVVSGLGLAAIRDFMSFLKYGKEVDAGIGDELGAFERAYGVGFSQGAMLFKELVYLGFNADEQGRQVFDGILAHLAGGRKTNLNQRFAQPTRTARPFRDLLYPSDLFPYSDAEQRSPTTGKRDGLLIRARKANVVPKIFHVHSSYEYFGAAAALTHTSVDGKRDLRVPETSRIYMIAGSQHGRARFPPARQGGRHVRNPNGHHWVLRALLPALDRWVSGGVAPPGSRYPRVEARTLVPVSEINFPTIPGTELPQRVHQARQLDFGRRFESDGIVDIEPPEVVGGFPTLLPQVDIDGNDLAGVRTPEITVPLATYTGWNLRSEELGAPTELLTSAGSFIPFATTRQERSETGDPRLSLEERYADRADYLQQIRKASLKMADEGFLLERDIGPLYSHAAELWSFVGGPASGSVADAQR